MLSNQFKSGKGIIFSEEEGGGSKFQRLLLQIPSPKI